MTHDWNYKGIIPALALPLKADLAIDEQELRRLSQWLATFKGISALMTNGHTGDVFSLTWQERAEVTRIVADEVKGKLPVISAVSRRRHPRGDRAGRRCRKPRARRGSTSCRRITGCASACARSTSSTTSRRSARRPGSISPCTCIRRGRALRTTCETLAGLARLPWVKLFKVGTREMNKYARDIEAIRDAAPEKAVLTCHDEYLLASMVQGVDGGLLGFASFIPELILELTEAVHAGDLKRAMAVQARINPLKDIVYGMGEPTGDAHARMKLAMVDGGTARSRRPCGRRRTQPDDANAQQIAKVLRSAGMLQKEAA